MLSALLGLLGSLLDLLDNLFADCLAGFLGLFALTDRLTCCFAVLGLPLHLAVVSSLTEKLCLAFLTTLAVVRPLCRTPDLAHLGLEDAHAVKLLALCLGPHTPEPFGAIA